MSRIYTQVLFLTGLLLSSCVEDKPEYFELGKDSYDKGNYTLAKNQFSMVKSSNANFFKTRDFLFKIDSIQQDNLKESIKQDSLAKILSKDLRTKYSGNYKIEVLGTSSDKEVEIYILKDNGEAEWLWVYYKGNVVNIDDRKLGTWEATESSLNISIRGNSGIITEVYSEKNGALINNQLTKRRLEKTNESF